MWYMYTYIHIYTHTHTHTYTMEYYSIIKKEWNNTICSTMDRPRDCQTKWSKPDKDKYDITYMANLKHKWQMTQWTYLQNRNRLACVHAKLLQLCLTPLQPYGL